MLPKRLVILVTLFAVSALGAGQAAAISLLQPTGLEDAVTLGAGKGSFRLGVSYLEDSPLLFQREGTDRTQISVPEMELRLGLGKRVEVMARYDLLHVNQTGQDGELGSGDLLLGTKINLLQEDLQLPAIGLRFATKLPAASEKDGLGTGATDVFVDLLATRNFPLFSVYGNLGLAVLGNPAGEQEEKLHYAAGVSIPFQASGITVLAGIEGLDLNDSLNDRGSLTVGLQYDFGQALFDFGVRNGYRSRSEDWGVRAGLTTLFDLPAGW